MSRVVLVIASSVFGAGNSAETRARRARSRASDKCDTMKYQSGIHFIRYCSESLTGNDFFATNHGSKDKIEEITRELHSLHDKV